MIILFTILWLIPVGLAIFLLKRYYNLLKKLEEWKKVYNKNNEAIDKYFELINDYLGIKSYNEFGMREHMKIIEKHDSRFNLLFYHLGVNLIKNPSCSPYYSLSKKDEKEQHNKDEKK
jgi:hypothetical protein